jgi:hypothetical protein
VSLVEPDDPFFEIVDRVTGINKRSRLNIWWVTQYSFKNWFEKFHAKIAFRGSMLKCIDKYTILDTLVEFSANFYKNLEKFIPLTLGYSVRV